MVWERKFQRSTHFFPPEHRMKSPWKKRFGRKNPPLPVLDLRELCSKGFFGARLLHWVGLRPQKLWPLSPAHPAHAGFSQALPVPERAFKRGEHLLSQIHNHLLAKHQKHQGNGDLLVWHCVAIYCWCEFSCLRGVWWVFAGVGCVNYSQVSKKLKSGDTVRRVSIPRFRTPIFFSAKKVYFASEVKPPTVKPPT